MFPKHLRPKAYKIVLFVRNKNVLLLCISSIDCVAIVYGESVCGADRTILL